MELRPYQQEAREAVEQDWKSGITRTGSGQAFEVYWFKVCSRKSRRELSGKLVSRCSWFCAVYAETETSSTV